MKRVAIVENGWGKIVSDKWVSGCREYIFENNLEAQFYVFNIFSNSNMDERYNIGELNIVNLPDFKKFDGVILELTNIVNKEYRNEIIKKVEDSGVPTVMLGEMGSNFHFSGIDNYYAMEQMVEHMIAVHGAKKINFVGGTVTNQENELRLLAYRDTLEKYGIEVEEERIFQNTFEVSTGMQAFDYFVDRNLLPDAIVCANDNIAVGVIHEAQTMGYKVPQDFLVSGFDNFDKASYCTPKITTVDFKREDLSYNAMKILDKVWQGETDIEDELAETTCIFQESCGCTSINQVNLAKYVFNNLVQEDRENKVDSYLMMMKTSLKHCTSFKDVAACLPDYLYSFDYDELFVIINRELFDIDVATILKEYSSGNIKNHGYPDDMVVLLATSQNRIQTGIELKSGQLLPEMDNTEPGEFYLFAPLHFEDREVGYMVLKNCDKLMESKLLYEILNMLMECMKDIFKNLLLEELVKHRLEE